MGNEPEVNDASTEPPPTPPSSPDEPLPAELKAVDPLIMDEDSVRGSASPQPGEIYLRGD